MNRYVGFNHIRRDPDLEPIRGVRVDSLLAIYETKMQERIRAFKGEETKESNDERIVEIPFTKAGGVTKVDCTSMVCLLISYLILEQVM